MVLQKWIRFLNVSRSLGDYWSFNPRTKQYAVSPEPYVTAIPVDPASQKFIVIASDGLWNVMTPQDVVSFIHDYEYHRFGDQLNEVVTTALIREALHRWDIKKLQADNIAILIVFLDANGQSSVVIQYPKEVNASSVNHDQCVPTFCGSHLSTASSSKHNPFISLLSSCSESPNRCCQDISRFGLSCDREVG